jgi:hypothetical protein
MKIVLCGYFDAGFSIGIDDFSFSNPKGLSKFESATGCKIYHKFYKKDKYILKENQNSEENNILINSDEHIGIYINIGNGIKIDLLKSDILNLLHKDALQTCADNTFRYEYFSESPNDLMQKVEKFQNTIGFKNFNAVFYGLGIGYFYLESEEFSDDLKNYALWLFRCYEYACYGTFCEGVFCKEFKKLTLKTYALFSYKNKIIDLTIRKIPTDFFPGFQLLIICNNIGESDLAHDILASYDDLEKIVMDDGTVYFGWAAAIIEAIKSKHPNRILHLLRIAHVFFGICDAFERLFTYHISESVRHSLLKTQTYYDSLSLNQLRTIGHTVSVFTRFNSLTQNSSDLKLLNAFDNLGRFSLKQEQMTSACEIFTSLQNEILDKKQSLRDKRINTYAMALTALTIISVTADMININDYLASNELTIILKIIALQGFIILIIYIVFAGKMKKRKKKK